MRLLQRTEPFGDWDSVEGYADELKRELVWVLRISQVRFQELRAVRHPTIEELPYRRRTGTGVRFHGRLVAARRQA